MARRSEEAQQVQAKIQGLLTGSGRIGAFQRELLASSQLELAYQEALETHRAGDHSRAEQLMRAAAREADGIAANYPHDDRSYRRWHGTAGLLSAQAALMRTLSLMSLYAFDQIPDGEAAAARTAAELLASISEPNSAAARFYSQSLTLAEQMAKVMLQVLGSSFSSQEAKFLALRKNAADARKLIPEAAGMESSAMNQYCDQLDQWLSNLQRLAKPKDRNMLRGLAACGMEPGGDG
jgi:hypothetical protein